MVEWLRLLIFSALYCSSSLGWSLAWVTCETSQVLLAGDQVVFLRDLPFSPHLGIGLAQNECNNLDRPLHPNKKIIYILFCLSVL